MPWLSGGGSALAAVSRYAVSGTGVVSATTGGSGGSGGSDLCPAAAVTSSLDARDAGSYAALLGDELSVVYRQCVRQINHWKHLHRERFVELSFENLGTNVRIVDTRFIAADSYELGDVPSRILLLCNSRPVARKHLWEELIRAGVDVQEADFDNSLYYLDEKRLLWREGDLVLGLPVEKKICDQRNKSNWTSSWPAIYV